MDLEALIIVSGASFLIGGVLYLIGHFFAKKWLRNHPKDRAVKVKLGGFVTTGLFLVTMGAGLTSVVYAPGSEFASFIQGTGGLLSWFILSVLVQLVANISLRMCGIETVVIETEGRDV